MRDILLISLIFLVVSCNGVVEFIKEFKDQKKFFSSNRGKKKKKKLFEELKII